MKRMSIIMLLYVILFNIGCLFAYHEDEIVRLYNSGNEFFKNSEWDSAIVCYSKAVELGARDWRVFYNLGNSFYRIGDVASALLWYERARILAPRQPNILKNIEFVRSQLPDKIELLYEGTVIGILRHIPNFVSSAELWWLLSIVSSIATLFSVFWIVRRKFGFLSVIFWTLFILLLAVWFFKHSMIFEKSPAIVLATKVDVMSAPSENSELLFTIHAGTMVGILEERYNWYRIVLENGHSGWLPNHTVEEVWRFPKMNI